MKKKLLLCITSLVIGASSMQAQTTIPTPDLLDVKFEKSIRSGAAVDKSPMDFSILKGPSSPVIEYDPEIKQFVSQFKNDSRQEYFRFKYKDKTAFKEKLKESFTIELYTRTETNKKTAIFASTQSGGIGVAVNENTSGYPKGTRLWYQDSKTKQYNLPGEERFYSSDNTKYDHIVFTYSKNTGAATGTVSYYLNGKLISTTPNLAPVNFVADVYQEFYIGGDVSPNSNLTQFMYNGNIASVKMYSQALNTTQISDLYNSIIKRSQLKGVDDLSQVISSILPTYIEKESNTSKNSLAEIYLEEGWSLMNSLITTQSDIDSYLSKLETNLGVTPKYDKPLRFAVVTDIHLNATNAYKAQDKFRETINILNEQADNLDALLITGDITDTWEKTKKAQEYTIYNSIVAGLSKNINVYNLMGNHDLWGESGNFNVYENKLGARNRAFTIKGYPIIMLSEDSDSPTNGKYIHYNANSMIFLENALADAARRYPDKPIFVFAHVPATNTTLGSKPSDFGAAGRFFSDQINEKLIKYQQAILFTGHLHTSIGDERSIYQESFTSVNAGSLAYATRTPIIVNNQSVQLTDNYKLNQGFPVNNPNTPTRGEEVAEGLFVEILPNKSIEIKRWDFATNTEIKQDSRWIVSYPYTKSNFVYTSKRDGGESPYFADGSEITYTNGRITFPQALDDDLVDYYNIKMISYNTVKEEYNISSLFHLNTKQPKELSWPIGYGQFEIRAVDSYGNVSKPLIGGLKEGEMPLYLIGAATSIGWDNTKALPMINESENVYTWEGRLNAGHFKFITQLSTWNSIVPNVAAHVNVGTSGQNYQVSDYYRGDYRFNLLSTGDYIIRVDLNKKTMYVEKKPYLIGDATSVSWNNSNPIPMDIESDGVFTWEGYLKSGQIKLLTDLYTWRSLTTTKNYNEIINIDTEYKLADNYSNLRPEAFYLTNSGYYIVKANLNKKTIIITQADKASTIMKSFLIDATNSACKINSNNNSIEITTNNPLDAISVWDINGRLVFSKENQSGIISIDNLRGGIYIVKISSAGKEDITKVLVK